MPTHKAFIEYWSDCADVRFQNVILKFELALKLKGAGPNGKGTVHVGRYIWFRWACADPESFGRGVSTPL